MSSCCHSENVTMVISVSFWRKIRQNLMWIDYFRLLSLLSLLSATSNNLLISPIAWMLVFCQQQTRVSKALNEIWHSCFLFSHMKVMWDNGVWAAYHNTDFYLFSELFGFLTGWVGHGSARFDFNPVLNVILCSLLILPMRLEL